VLGSYSRECRQIPLKLITILKGVYNGCKKFIKETIQKLAANGKTIADVKFVNTQKASCSWDEFARVADREYEGGYGETEIYMDVVVAGEGWWLERREYDGSEWWNTRSCQHRNHQVKLPRKMYLETNLTTIL
jgi:hypothetical protein